jgi:hypothetical protein
MDKPINHGAAYYLNLRYIYPHFYSGYTLCTQELC